MALTPQQFGTWLSIARAQLYLGLNQWTTCLSPLAPPPLWLQPLPATCLTPPTPISISGPPSPLLVHLPPPFLSLQLPFKTSFSSGTHLFLPQSPLFRGLFLRAPVSQGSPLLTASWLYRLFAVSWQPHPLPLGFPLPQGLLSPSHLWSLGARYLPRPSPAS